MPTDDRTKLDELTGKFFAFFDNRNARFPIASDFIRLFEPHALITSHSTAGPKIADPATFVEPRIRLLTSGNLTEFHEWETDAQTEVVDTLGLRRSTYAKYGMLHGRPYSGHGIKHFHFAKSNGTWRIVTVSWIDATTVEGQSAT